MKSALVIQHMPHDGAGRFAELMAEASIKPRFVKVFSGEDIPPLHAFDFMLVLGGAQNTWEENRFPHLVMEKEAIREWVVERAKPYFGICLGHQLLAESLGGAVGLAAAAEIGVHKIAVQDNTSLFNRVPNEMQVMQWHHAEVVQLPNGAKSLASSSTTAVQAMQIGDHAFSTQFHCEFTPEAILGWSAIPSYIASLEDELGLGAHQRIVDSCWPLLPAMARQTRKIWDNFLMQSGL